jgi:hypothetical protein
MDYLPHAMAAALMSALVGCGGDGVAGDEGDDSKPRRWREPAGLDDAVSAAGSDGGAPRVAISSSGNATVTWSQGSELLFIHLRDGEWGSVTGQGLGIGAGATAFELAVDDNGDVIVIWEAMAGSWVRVQKNEYRDSNWGTTVLLSRDGSHAGESDVAMGEDAAVVVWEQTDGSRQQIYKSEYREGTWTHPSSPTDSLSADGTHAYRPSVAMAPNAHAVITWDQDIGSEHHVLVSEYRGTSWSLPAPLSVVTTVSHQAAVAMADNGDVIAAWVHSFGPRIGRRIYSDGAWTDGVSMVSNPGVDNESPYVAIASGGAAAVWEQSDGVFTDTFVASDNLATRLSPNSSTAAAPRVAVAGNGDAMAVWQQPHDAVLRVFRAERRRNAWSSPADTSAYMSLADTVATAPDVVANEDGQVVIAWQQSDGTHQRIFVSEYR